MWPWVLLLTLGGLAIKAGLVAGLTRLAGEDNAVALRTGIVVAIGGEFGFALLALAREGICFSPELLQIALSSVLLIMLLGPVLIRLNGPLALRLFPAGSARAAEELAEQTSSIDRHVILCGYGRVGQSLAHVLARSGIACVGLDFDPYQVREVRATGERGCITAIPAAGKSCWRPMPCCCWANLRPACSAASTKFGRNATDSCATWFRWTCQAGTLSAEKTSCAGCSL